MAKKSQKPNLPQETLERARRELARSGSLPAQPVSVDAAPKAKVKVNQATTQADLAQEYSYVVGDLQQMAILAAGIMVVLVILSFFI